MRTHEDRRRQCLQGILEREQNKTSLSNKVKLGHREPAKLRTLVLDTHDKLPTFAAIKARHAARADAADSSQVQRTGFENLNMLSKKSLHFGPAELHHDAISHAGKLAALAYSKRAHSEWALLDGFQSLEDMQQDIARRQKLATDKEEQRKVLDAQMEEHAQKLQALQRAKQQDAADIAAGLKVHEALVAQEAAQQRQKNMASAKMMSSQAQEYAEAKRRAKQQQLDEEQLELQETATALAEQQTRDAERLAAERRATKVTLAENAERIKAKRDRLKQQVKEEEAMMAAHQALLDKQAERREEELRAFRARTAVRAEAAGTAVKEEAAAREAAENARVEAAMAAADERAAANETARRARQAQIQADMSRAWEQQLQARRHQQAVLQEGKSRYLADLSRREADIRELEAQRRQAVKQLNMQLKLELERQIADRERQAVEEDAGMTPAERQINASQLRSALKADVACCVCGQCADCCAWQQARRRAHPK